MQNSTIVLGEGRGGGGSQAPDGKNRSGGVGGKRKGGKNQIINFAESRRKNNYTYVHCPGSSDPFYIVSYYIEWVTTSWTHGTCFFKFRL